MKTITLFLLFFTVLLQAQDKSPYQLYDKNGNKVTYANLLETTQKTQVVLFGEFHNNPICHWLELELAKNVSQLKPVVFGAEMIETDNQKQLNQYLNNEINQSQLDSLARLWPNYATDYKPLVDFAKEKKIPFIATNIPRRYASLVFKKGLEELQNLPTNEQQFIAPLPIKFDLNLPGYKSMLSMQEGKAGDKMPKAQAIKDATMAHFIIKNLQSNSVFIHYNGSYHSDNFEGINWYLKQYNPNIQIVTIATVEQQDITILEKENYNKANFILVIDADVTKTY